ncbi:MAG: ABC transporter permease [Muribaculaceae bacterium]|nr:ABC transporter permease [Muribaculaceae bacterium]MDE7188810.1 ABC transporter permease [Muribaculaceae bacterium]
MNSNIGIIISREVRERVVKKSFILTTLLTPLIMVLIWAAPVLIMEFSTPSDKNMAVIDESGIIFPELVKSADDMSYLTLTHTDTSLDSALHNDSYDAVLFINSDVVTNPQNVMLYTHESGSMEVEGLLNRVISKTVEDKRLEKYNIENLSEILDEVNVNTSIRTLRITDDGSEKDVSSMTSFMLGLGMTFILYMFLLIYGQMVMTSIIEEKNNRVLELVVSSVKPLQLMLGKIIGVGLVAVIQIVLWCALMCVMSAFIMPMIMPEGMTEEIAMMNSGSLDAATSAFDPDLLKAVALFSSVGYLLKLFMYLTLFLIGGFLFYASIFAAIGSSVDNIQDASQLQTFAILPIIVALVFGLSIGNDPNTTLAVWLSMIPFTSPMVMLSRIPFDIPSWQIWVSLVILYVSFVGMTWIAAKIYRVGIFMYGKKPTVKDLIHWARYK